jgi:peptide deformylase
MKTLNDLLLLGDERLYLVSGPVTVSDQSSIPAWVADLDHVMSEIRAKYHFGRAIAAPQLGIMKRLIYMNIDHPIVFINPEITYKSDELFEVWDDCMCFPQLFVKVMRHRTIRIKYLDEQWQAHEWEMKDDLSELFQHEYDHLEGILCTMRAIDDKSFKWRVIS